MKLESLDTVFSLFIRLRDSDSNGICRCISCGKIKHYLDIDNGHFVNRRHMSTRFDEQNCNAQCRSCNSFDEGNAAGYASGLMRKYGSEIIELLLAKKNQFKKYSQFEIDELGKYYRGKIKELKASKNVR